MFERSPPRARQAVVRAQEEARAPRATLHRHRARPARPARRDPTASPARRCNRLGVTGWSAPERGRGDRRAGEGRPSGHIPFTPRAKKVLELSLREALAAATTTSAPSTSPGLVREGEGVAMEVVKRQGVEPGERCAPRCSPGQRVTAGRAPRRAGAEHHAGRRRACSPRPAKLAGGAPMGTHHLLEALALADGSVAGNVLAAPRRRRRRDRREDRRGRRRGHQRRHAGARRRPPGGGPRRGRGRAHRARRRHDPARARRPPRRLDGQPDPRRTAGADSLIALWRANVAALQEIADRFATPDDDTRRSARRRCAPRSVTAYAVAGGWLNARRRCPDRVISPPSRSDRVRCWACWVVGESTRRSACWRWVGLVTVLLVVVVVIVVVGLIVGRLRCRRRGGVLLSTSSPGSDTKATGQR